MKRVDAAIIIIIGIIGIASIVSPIGMAEPEPAATINLDPYTSYVGSNITVPIEILNATEFAGGFANISFNPSIVNVQEVLAADFDTLEANVNNTNGFVRVAALRAKAVGKDKAQLASIRFKGISKGITALNITNVYLSNETGNLTYPGTVNGSINVSTSLLMYIASYDVYVDSNVMVPVEIKNAADIAGGSAKVVFNGSIVRVEEVTAGNFGTNVTANIDNANASVYIAVANASAVGIEDAVLANISFKGLSSGSATLEIHDAYLNDEYGNDIIPETSDGAINVTLKPIYNVSIKSEPMEQTVEQSKNATYTLTVTNLGNVTDTIELSITLNEANFAALSEDTFTLNAGASATAYLNVSDSDVEIYNTTVRATSEGNKSVFAEVTVKTNVTPQAPSPCFIATAAYGTPLHEDIDTLRKFRNKVLSTNTPGKALVETYYSTSPPIANALAANGCLRASVRVLLLTPLVYFAGITLNGGLFALIIAFLAGLLYLYRTRKYVIFGGILKSAVPGILSIAVLTSLVFTLGWLGYTWSGCATIAAYILPLIIPISIAVVLIAVIMPKYKNKFRLSSGGE